MSGRRAWFDPRLAIGAGLVLVSIGGVWGVVHATGSTQPVWSASDALLPGDVIADGDLVVADVRLGSAEGAYLAAGDAPVGQVVTQVVGAGELVPAAALGDAASIDVAPVVVQVRGGLPSSLGAGDAVDVWAAAPLEQGAFAAPTVLVDGATVVGVVEDEGLIADRSVVSVELLVPRGDTGGVLAAIANAHALSLVPEAVAAGGTP